MKEPERLLLNDLHFIKTYNKAISFPVKIKNK